METLIETNNTKTLMESFKQKENSNNICAVILNVNNDKFKTETKPYNLKIFGKTMTEWVANSVYDTNIKYAEYNFNDDFLPAVKQVADRNSELTFVLFSDAPLFQRKTYLQILEYFKMKDLNVLKLTRGYVFKTEYLFNINSLLSPQMQYFDEEDFITCYDLKQFSMVCDIMKNRILNYFMKNGVVIKDSTSTFIDADVQIEKGVIIEPYSIIKGKSIIEANCVVGAHSVIENSVVCENSIVNGCIIKNSFVGKNCVINENVKIENNCKIEDGVNVPYACYLNNVIVKIEDSLKSFYSYTAKED